MAFDYTIYQGDLGKVLSMVLEDAAGPVSLSWADTVVLVVGVDCAVPVISNPVVVDPDQVAHKGLVRYTFSGTDLDTPGDYDFVAVAHGGGTSITFPTDPTRPKRMRIKRKLGA